MRRVDRLLDGSWADPPKQIQRTAGLVVRAASTSATKGLLTDDSARWFVVDVEVSSTVAKSGNGRLDVASVGGKDGTRQCVFRRRVAQLERGLKVLVGVHVDDKTGPKISSAIVSLRGSLHTMVVG